MDEIQNHKSDKKASGKVCKGMRLAAGMTKEIIFILLKMDLPKTNHNTNYYYCLVIIKES